MTQYVAFLRGLNIGGHRVKMKDLRARFEAMGLTEVSSFLASGNLVFDAGDDPPGELEERIENDLGDTLGYEVPAFVRTAEQVRTIAERAPFSEAAIAASHGKPQVALLRGVPDADARLDVLAMGTEDDRLALEGLELHWLPSGGFRESKLDWKQIERQVGATTIRTHNTVQRLAAKFGDKR